MAQENLKRLVRETRRKLGLTQQDFATLLGLSFVSVNRWENGRAVPNGHHAALFTMLERSLRKPFAGDSLLGELRAANGEALGLIRVLARWEV